MTPSYFEYTAIKTGAQSAPEPRRENRAYPFHQADAYLWDAVNGVTIVDFKTTDK